MIETITDILSEMREYAKPLCVGGDWCNNVACPATIEGWADRIEAAMRREYGNAQRTSHNCNAKTALIDKA